MHPAVLLTLAALAAPGPEPTAPAALAEQAWAITDTVLEHHIGPPARQQMILDGLEALNQTTRPPVPELARKVSTITTVDQLKTLLDRFWLFRPDSTSAASGSTPSLREELFRTGLLANVSGGAWLMSANDAKADQQIAANQYVGLQIALMHNEKLKRSQVRELFEGGPAQRAGVLKGDLIEEIDGQTTDGLKLQDVVYRLRGAEGTSVTIRVRQPESDQSRTYTITRGVLPRQTIESIRSFAGDGVKLAKGPGLISYLRFREIAGSTPHELKQLARTLEDEGAKALVLDLRGVEQAGLHPTVLVADLLLDNGMIGRVRTAKGVETFQAESDALFRGWPMAVLVDRDTTGAAEWLAASLQDNHRAVIVGTTTGRPRDARLNADDLTGVKSIVPVGDGPWSIKMVTGRLERCDGRPLARPPAMAQRERGEGDRDGGVQPDIVADSPLSRPARARPGAPEAEPNVSGDSALAAANQRLREELKLAPVAPRRGPLRSVSLRNEGHP